MAGTSSKAVAQKLGIKPGFCIFVDGGPSAFRSLVGPLPAHVWITTAPRSSLDMVHLFATRVAGLVAKFRIYRAAIAPHGMIWVSWPKKSSSFAGYLSDVVARDTALPLGLVDIKVCAIDDTWSGLKFAIP